MKATTYLLVTTLKNKLKLLLKRPLMLILVILFTIFMVAMLLLSLIMPLDEVEFRNPTEMYLIIFAFLSFIFFLTAFNGLKTGATFFTMPDVNLLFTAPIKPKTILHYGLIKQIGTSLFVGIFLVFQYTWLRASYGLNILSFFIFLLSYSINLFLSQLTGMAIYTHTSSHDKRRTIIKIILYLFFLLIISYALYLFVLYYPDINTIIGNINSNFFFFIPVAGWLTALCVGVIEGNLLFILIGLLSSLILCITLILLISNLNTDYYEDVVKTTEYVHSILSARKEGKLVEAIPRNVKLGDVGIHKGKGASVLYFKLMKESKRKKIFIFDGVQMFLLFATIIFAFIVKKEGLFPIYIFSLYLSMLTITLGRWVKELNHHYIYLIPESSFRKLIFILLENFKQIVIFTTIQYLILFLITQEQIISILFYAISFISFNFIFTAITVLTDRIFGQISNKFLNGFLYLILVVIVALPGIIGGVIISAFFNNEVLFILGISSLWNIFISLIILFACRNILSVAEIKN
ncbi:MAG TPA: hypothetical protein GXZ48_05075 [Acholeplasmataceae bacterium]|nr:hypothetical protein [Acholeplasmataceae bacterium]